MIYQSKNAIIDRQSSNLWLIKYLYTDNQSFMEKMNNLKAIKKLADREGISLNQLMKILKNGE